MSASLSTSLRADYGGALDICVAIFGRVDQHSAGAEGAPYRLSMGGFEVSTIVRRWKECGYFFLRALSWLCLGAWPFVQTLRVCLRRQG
eukprot:scaffold978_cov118-Isochrysis_galbana.AAC.2